MTIFLLLLALLSLTAVVATLVSVVRDGYGVRRPPHPPLDDRSAIDHSRML